MAALTILMEILGRILIMDQVGQVHLATTGVTLTDMVVTWVMDSATAGAARGILTMAVTLPTTSTGIIAGMDIQPR